MLVASNVLRVLSEALQTLLCYIDSLYYNASPWLCASIIAYSESHETISVTLSVVVNRWPGGVRSPKLWAY